MNIKFRKFILALTLTFVCVSLSACAIADRDAVNRRGGDVTLVHLPETGIRGNTHFPFSDLNNLEIANLMYNFLEKKGLN